MGVRAAESDDFADYVNSQGPALFRTAYLLTGDRVEAEDLLQDALARLCRSWHRVRERESTDAYVRRTMINLRTSHWRRHRVSTVTLPDLPDVIDPRGDPASGVVDRDQLRTALAALPPRMRAVIVLRYFEDLSEADIAQVMQCSVGNVKSQSSRALAKLRASTQTEFTHVD